MCVYILVLLFWILYKTCELILEHLLSIRGQGQQRYTFGRGLDCDVVIEQDMTNVRVDTLSWIHCTIRRDENSKPDRKTVIEDNSANGTFVNRVLIDKQQVTCLRHGDVIAMACQFGDVFTYLDSKPGDNNNFSSEVNRNYCSQTWRRVRFSLNQKFTVFIDKCFYCSS